MAALNVHLAAKMVAETEILTVKQVAAKYDTTRQTVGNHLAREAKGKENGADLRLVAFAEACRKEREALRAELERRKIEWADVGIRALRTSFEVLEALVLSVKPKDGAKPDKGVIREVAGAIKIVGELQVVRSVLNGGGALDPEQGRSAAEAARRPAGGPDPVH